VPIPPTGSPERNRRSSVLTRVMNTGTLCYKLIQVLLLLEDS
jgi:hypothetical protein